MKTTQRLVLAVFALVGFTLLAIAQTTNGVPVDGTALPLPATPSEYWTLGIAAVSSLIVGGVYKLVPLIPKVLLPTMTPLVGIGLGLLINWVGSQQLTWVDMAQAGGLAVFVREVFNQAVTKQLSQSPAPAATPKA